MSAAGLMLLSVHGAVPATSTQDGLRPRWVPEVEPTVSKPEVNVVQWLQTSVRPGYNGLTVKSESASDEDDDSDHVPASIQPSTNEQTLIDDGRGEEGSKWPDSHQYRPQTSNKTADLRSSVRAHLINSASDTNDGDVLLNRTHSEYSHLLNKRILHVLYCSILPRVGYGGS